MTRLARKRPLQIMLRLHVSIDTANTLITLNQSSKDTTLSHTSLSRNVYTRRNPRPCLLLKLLLPPLPLPPIYSYPSPSPSHLRDIPELHHLPSPPSNPLLRRNDVLALFRLDLSHAASTAGVRIITVDRPGFGGSTPVPVPQRVDVWLETVPAVLAALDVEHVALVSHSAGAIYLMNTLVRLPHVLHPTHPVAFVQAPWVHPEHSGTGLLDLASRLSRGLIERFSDVQRLVVDSVNLSSGVLGLFEGLLSADRVSLEDEEEARLYGVCAAEWRVREKLRGLYMRAEDVRRLLLGAYEDLPACIGTIIENDRTRLSAADDLSTRKKGASAGDKTTSSAITAPSAPTTSTPNSKPSPQPSPQPLRFRAHFSETDIMIGKGGQTYFEKCWADALATIDPQGGERADGGGRTDGGRGTDEGGRTAVDFTSKTIKGTNHETVISLRYTDGMRAIFEEIAGLGV
ncbi:hypothetical protein MRB53_037546 [Persea americana]|nr:hypothetical protein MRB53_037546 [Persea americana]